MPFPDQLPIPPEVLEIVEKLQSAGYATYCVGGAIRDNLLGHPNKDFDLATAAKPNEVREIFRRTVPVGIEHGTVAVLDRNDALHEVTTFRKDVATDGRHAEVEFGVSLEEDLARRDFTINAIAYHPFEHVWFDPFDGAGDLERKVIRAVGDPEQRFREDYLRILRAVRFSARFGFKIDPETWQAAKANAEGLAQLSAERVRDEWFKGLETADRGAELVRLWDEVGALARWLPETQAAMFDGRRSVIDKLGDPDPILITAFLSDDPTASLSRLKCSNADIKRAASISKNQVWPDANDGAKVRRWMSGAYEVVDDLVAINRAGGRGKGLEAAVDGERTAGVPLSIADLAVDGTDLIEHGVPRGPAVGKTLIRLLDEVLKDPSLNTKEQLLDLIS